MTLSVEDLAFGYPGRPVGRSTTFNLEPGEVLCLLGPNGSGKTTLSKTVLGLLKPQGGRIRFDGEDMTRWPRARFARNLGYVPQAHEAFFPFAVRDIVLMGRAARIGPFATPSARDHEAAEAALAALGIGDLADRSYVEISGGQRQLALIARALAQEARVLVMDEPTASLDFGNRLVVLNQVRMLARRGIGIILSTHDPEHAFVCADRVAMLHEGRLFRLGLPNDVITPDNLNAIYGVSVDVVVLPGTDRRVCVPAFGDDGAAGRPPPE